MIVTHGEDEYTGRPPVNLVPFGVDWQNKSFTRARYDRQYRQTAMDEECYGRFIPKELHAATRDLKQAVLHDQIAAVGCKHGLHRSVAGARFVGEELAGEGQCNFSSYLICLCVESVSVSSLFLPMFTDCCLLGILFVHALIVSM